MSRENVDKIIELQNKRLSVAKKISSCSTHEEKNKLREEIQNIKKDLSLVSTTDPEAAKRLKELLKNLPNISSGCDCMGDAQ